MNIVLKCQECGGTHSISLDFEYFLPSRCPACGHVYKDYDMLKSWLDKTQAQLRREKGGR